MLILKTGQLDCLQAAFAPNSVRMGQENDAASSVLLDACF